MAPMGMEMMRRRWLWTGLESSLSDRLCIIWSSIAHLYRLCAAFVSPLYRRRIAFVSQRILPVYRGTCRTFVSHIRVTGVLALIVFASSASSSSCSSSASASA